MARVYGRVLQKVVEFFRITFYSLSADHGYFSYTDSRLKPASYRYRHENHARDGTGAHLSCLCHSIKQ